MKQGRTETRDAGHKREPVAHAINPGGAAQLGSMAIKNPTPLNAGRGFEAPKAGAQVHECGSQGKHK